jgi:hypothetical protein
VQKKLFTDSEFEDAFSISQKYPFQPIQVAADRLDCPRSDDLVSLNLAMLSKSDLERVLQLQRDYFRELRNIVAASTPEESAVLVLMQVLSLAPESDNNRK